MSLTTAIVLTCVIFLLAAWSVGTTVALVKIAHRVSVLEAMLRGRPRR